MMLARQDYGRTGSIMVVRNLGRDSRKSTSYLDCVPLVATLPRKGGYSRENFFQICGEVRGFQKLPEPRRGPMEKRAAGMKSRRESEGMF
jgi:hypothetical protein